MSRSSRFLDDLKWGSRSPSRSPSPGNSGSFSDRFTTRRPRAECRNNTANQSISTSTSQLPTAPSSILAQPQSSGTPRTPDVPTYGPSPLTTGGEVAAAFSGDHTPTSSSDVQGSSLVFISTPIVRVPHSQFEPIESQNPAPPSTGTPSIPTCTSQVQALAKTGVHVAVLPPTKSPLDPDVIEPVVWTKTLKIARKKLNDNSLPPLDLTTLTSQSAEKNIQAIVKGLKTLQEDDEKKRWSYTWHGRKVIVVESLAKILRYVEKYSKVVDIGIQSHPEVSALVWAGVWGIMRVCI